MRLKNTLKLILILLLITFIVSGKEVIAAAANIIIGEEFNDLDLNSPQKAYVIDYKRADVTGDLIEDNIILVGIKPFSKDDIYAEDLTIVVEDGANGEYLKATYEYFGGYEGKLFVGDFTGDEVKDVMVFAPTGGSGGIVEHLIATFTDQRTKVIFTDKENQGLRIKGKYIDDFKAEIEISNNKSIHEIVLDIKDKKDFYCEQGIYDEEGRLLQEIIPFISPFSRLEPVDYDLDGIYELRGDQRIVGTCNADSISYLQSVLKYDGEQWKIKELYLYKLIDYLL